MDSRKKDLLPQHHETEGDPEELRLDIINKKADVLLKEATELSAGAAQLEKDVEKVAEETGVDVNSKEVHQSRFENVNQESLSFDECLNMINEAVEAGEPVPVYFVRDTFDKIKGTQDQGYDAEESEAQMDLLNEMTHKDGVVFLKGNKQVNLSQLETVANQRDQKEEQEALMRGLVTRVINKLGQLKNFIGKAEKAKRDEDPRNSWIVPVKGTFKEAYTEIDNSKGRKKSSLDSTKIIDTGVAELEEIVEKFKMMQEEGVAISEKELKKAFGLIPEDKHTLSIEDRGKVRKLARIINEILNNENTQLELENGEKTTFALNELRKKIENHISRNEEVPSELLVKLEHTTDNAKRLKGVDIYKLEVECEEIIKKATECNLKASREKLKSSILENIKKGKAVNSKSLQDLYESEGIDDADLDILLNQNSDPLKLLEISKKPQNKTLFEIRYLIQKYGLTFIHPDGTEESVPPSTSAHPREEKPDQLAIVKNYFTEYLRKEKPDQLVTVKNNFTEYLRKEENIGEETTAEEQERLLKVLGVLLSELSIEFAKISDEEKNELINLLQDIHLKQTDVLGDGVEETMNPVETTNFLKFLHFVKTKINDPEFAKSIEEPQKDTLRHVIKQIRNMLNRPIQEKIKIEDILKGDSENNKFFKENEAAKSKAEKEITEKITNLEKEAGDPKSMESVAYKLALLKEVLGGIKDRAWNEGTTLINETNKLREMIAQKERELEEKERKLKKMHADYKMALDTHDNEAIIKLTKEIPALEKEITELENKIGALEIMVQKRVDILKEVKKHAKRISTLETVAANNESTDEVKEMITEAKEEEKKIKELVHPHKDEHHGDHHGGHGKHGHGHGHHHKENKWASAGLVSLSLFSGLFVRWMSTLYDTILEKKGGGGGHGGGGDHGSHAKAHH